MSSTEANHRRPAVPATGPAAVAETASATASLVTVVLVALAVRLGYLWSIADRPELLAPAPGLAEDLYLALARRVAAGDLLLSDDVYWYSPLYAYLSGALTALFGEAPWVVHGANVLLGSGTVFLLYQAVLHSSLPRPVALIAAWIAALYGPWVLIDSSAMPDSAGLFLLALTLWLVQRARCGGSMRLWLGAGVALGGVVNLLDGLGLFSLLLPAWLLLAGPTMPGQPGMPLKGRGLRVGLLVVGMAMAILPFTLRNLVVGGELVPIAAKSGVERYAGNNPNAWGGHMTIPGIRPNPAGLWSDGRRVAEWALGRQARSSEVSAYWTDRTLEFIRAEPGHFLSLVWTRLLLSINAYEIAQTYSWQYEAMRSKLLATLPGIGLLLSLGLAGALLALPRIRDLVPWYLLAVAVLTGLMLTQVNWRDRMPLLLGLLPFAALYLVVIRDWLRKRRWSRFIPGLLLVSAMAVLVHLPRVDANIRQREIAVAERNSRTSATLRQLMERLDAPQLSPSLRRHLYLRIANLRRSHLDHEGAARVLKEAVIHFPDDQQSRRLLERAAKRIDDQVSVVEARRAIERRRSTAANEIHGR